MEGILGRVSDATLREGNRLALLENGPATYDDWLQAISRAKHWIHLDNYIFENDEIGHRFADALSAKAAEGVTVRVLHDWFGCMDVPRSFWEGLREAGVEVRAVRPRRARLSGRSGATTANFSPWTVSMPRRRRVHLRRLDGSLAGDRTALPGHAVSLRGPAVADVERALPACGTRCQVSCPTMSAPAKDIQPAGEEAVRVVIQEPRRMRTLRLLELLTAGVEERLWITDPYFLSMPILTQSLMATARDGVDVRVLTPATNDIPWIGRASRAGYRQFLEAGVRIFEYGGPMIHAKTIVADGWWSKVGSTNLNFSSLVANWEIDLVAEDPALPRRWSGFSRTTSPTVGKSAWKAPDNTEGCVPTVRWTTAIAGCAAGSSVAARGRGPPSPGWAAPSSRRAGLRFKPTSMPSLPQPAVPCS